MGCAPSGGGAFEDGAGSAAMPAGACARGAEGCPCATEGMTTECGRIKEQVGDLVTCSMGRRTCAGGVWGACVGDSIVVKSVPAPGTIHGLGLGTKASCDNACDPYCAQIADTPDGLPLPPDGGLVVTDGGLTLEGTATPTTSTCTGLTIVPKPATDLVVNVAMAPSPSSKVFSAQLTPASCYAGGAAPALWSVDKFDIAQVDNGIMTLVTPIAGPIQVSAYAGTLSDSVTVNVRVDVVDETVAPAGETAATYASSAGPVDSIEILYPYANTVFPLGLLPPRVMWRDNGSPPATATSVKLTLRYPATGTPIFQWSEIVPENQSSPTPSLAAKPRAFIPQSVWFAFEQTVTRNSATYGDGAIIALRRHVGPGAARGEVTIPVKFANGQLKGRILYNSYGTNLVQNYGNTRWGTRFGAATLAIPPYGTTPSVVAGATSSSNGPGCRVCHSVSADGTELVTNRFQPNDKTTSRYDLTTATPTESLLGASTGDGRFSWPALFPDGSLLFTNAGPPKFQGTNTSQTSKLYTIAGSAISSPAMPTTLKAASPAFSHDGTAVAFNFYAGTASPLPSPSSGPTTGNGTSLAMMSFDPTTKAFSSFRNLYVAPSSGSITGTPSWPSFLPPGEDGIVFHRELRYNGRDFAGTRSDCDGTGSCNNQGTTAELWWVNTTGTPQPVRLDKLNGWDAGASYLPKAGNLHGDPANATFDDPYYNYEPTVLPITAGGYSWVVFTSRRLYGNVATINPYWSDPRFQYLNAEPTPKKLWVAAIDKSPTPGADPSHPAFYLPGQELLAGNSRGYFVLEACHPPGTTDASLCDTTADCCQSPSASVCQLDPPPLASPPVRHCTAATPSACKSDGDACSSHSECCNFATGSRCASGVCSVPPPVASYAATTYTRAYTTDCITGFSPVWRFFEWQSVTPTGTEIEFEARTRKPGGVFGAPVAIGKAHGASIAPPSWGRGATSIDGALAASGQSSAEELEVVMVFRPKTSSPSAAPTLLNWRVSYDCVPTE